MTECAQALVKGMHGIKGKVLKVRQNENDAKVIDYANKVVLRFQKG